MHGEKFNKSIQYGYSYQNSCTDNNMHSDSLEIKLTCPRISSIKWCLQLYTLVLSGLGLILSVVWISFHLYVVSQTTTYELRVARYRPNSVYSVIFCARLIY